MVGRVKKTIHLPSTAKTATATYGPYDNVTGRALRVIVKTANPVASPSVVFKIQSVDPFGTATDVLSSAAVATATTTVLEVGPDIAAAANARALAYAPTRWQLVATHADADSIDVAIASEQLP